MAQFVSTSALVILSLRSIVNCTGCDLRSFYLQRLVVDVYAFALAVAAFVVRNHSAPAYHTHLSILLFFNFALYAYRDLYPLTTTHARPQDEAEGWAIWLRVAFLTWGGILIPLLAPRSVTRTEGDKDNQSLLSPEQTASWVSSLTYHWLQPTISKAASASHLPVDELPPLGPESRADVLRDRAFKHLDTFSGAKRRHLGFGMLQIFAWEWLEMSFLLVLQVIGDFASPIGIQQLLKYIEVDGEGVTHRPWIWICWLFAGPFIASLCFERFVYIATTMLIRVESIITQLLFEHALRIRIQVDVSDEDSTNLAGRLNNLATSDIASIGRAKYWLKYVIYIPLSIAVAVYFLYNILGWSALVGLGSIVVSIPVTAYLGTIMSRIFGRVLEAGDSRVQSVTETLNIIRMVKLFGWEKRMEERIDEKREVELTALRDLNLYSLFLSVINNITNIMGEELNASKVFSSITVFDIFARLLNDLAHELTEILNAKVSLDRVSDFLQTTELLDTYTDENAVDVPENARDRIAFHNARFTWSKGKGSENGTTTPSSRPFELYVEDLTFRRGGVNLIIGPTGCGKTSMLMALLGEMHFESVDDESWFNLPRNEGVAYAAQESWVLNASIKDNILFGAPLDKERYDAVVRACALERDMSFFDAGDETEVGERGVTLSGGQRARLTLARAIYSPAAIIILDDALAALDVHTTKWIVDKCLGGPLVKDRTVLLVTHNIAITRRVAAYVVAIENGKIKEQGTFNEVLRVDAELSNELAEEEHAIEQDLNKEDAVTDQKDSKSAPASGKLIVKEEITEGLVSWQSYKLWLQAVGGSFPILFFTSCIGAIVIQEIFTTLQIWYLGVWANQYDVVDAGDVDTARYMGIYALFTIAIFGFYGLGYIIAVIGTIRASRKVSRALMGSILSATMHWLDTTPVSRIITRCTQDLQAVDTEIADNTLALLIYGSIIVNKFLAIVVVTPIFLLWGLAVLLVGLQFARTYGKAQLSVKREMSNARAPLLGHFGAAMSGLVSIRAYGAQESSIQESMTRIDRYTRPALVYYNMNRWVAVRTDGLSALLSAGLATYLVYVSRDTASNTGFSLNMAVAFNGLIVILVRYLNELQVVGNSLERIQQYMEIEHEPAPTGKGIPPAYWPASGALSVQGLSARYSADGPEVLKNLSFDIQSGERIGIVGRTGSGKSSLTLSLLRCIPTSPENAIRLDGIPTDEINLNALRSSITIIPQVPELLSGTIRDNLDPFSEHDDATLNDALRQSGLFSLQAELEEGKEGINLDTTVSSGGGNLSIGQRQILAMARALVRRSKVLVLDEASSAVDYTTDALIQKSLRQLSRSDVTVLTVAHRLQTVMDADRIMVLDAGSIVEFDSPKVLLENTSGLLRTMVDASSDKDVLYNLAGL
ncbi:P-loop containing nucleoside triphosphate hydrolase protein [Cylindrobasidium torrendii FP15055 ss-10]|uniref:p-loop containing nucleoside triphosphate hydrolase protein n=1 Tax=Cylindrobasidium torrendii FP15055 ss-10 TaxID=1314674 RepID=A0A0D7B0S5_9AGAR|nr:P-loop containing nucleoside triphosphate hydrolase protein [Cylindrobasidium torrendii FP15055 ss-10]